MHINEIGRDGLDIGPSVLGDLGKLCGLVPYEY